MKICCQLPISMPEATFAPYYDLLKKSYQLFKHEDTEIAIKDVPSGVSNPSLISYVSFREVNNIEIVKNMLKAQQDGFDAIAGAAFMELGASIASNILSIPVVDAPTSAMRLAQMIGKKFAIITSEQAFIPLMEQYIQLNGCKESALFPNPVRCLNMPVQKIFECLLGNDHEPLIKSFFETAEQCVSDGADTIIVGCGLVAPILSVNNYFDVYGAVIIDSLAASLKFAELMVNLSNSGMKIKPNTGLLCRPSEDLRQAGLQELNLI